MYLYLLKKHTTMNLRELSKLAGMNYRSAGELARRFEKEMKESKKFAKLVEKTEKILATE